MHSINPAVLSNNIKHRKVYYKKKQFSFIAAIIKTTFGTQIKVFVN
jgi:hypothetical protein